MNSLIEISKQACFAVLVSFSTLPAIPPLSLVGRLGARVARVVLPDKREIASLALADNYKRSGKLSAARTIVERHLERRSNTPFSSEGEELFAYPQTLDWLLLLKEIDETAVARFAPTISELLCVYGMDEENLGPQPQVTRLAERRDEFLVLLQKIGWPSVDDSKPNPKQLREAATQMSGVHREYLQQLESLPE